MFFKIGALKSQSHHQIEICRTNQLTGLYMMATLAFNKLIKVINPFQANVLYLYSLKKLGNERFLIIFI